MVYVFLALNGLVMLALPLVVGTVLARRYRGDWGLFGAGAATFTAAQVLHIPFNSFVEARYFPTSEAIQEGTRIFVLVALFYGFSAGIFEEVARYLTYRFWRRDAKSWAEGLMVGAGHGGIESLLLGLLFVVNTTVLVGAANGYFRGLLPADSLPEVEAQVDALLTLPWYELILGGVERILTIFVHLALSLMALRAVSARSLRWLFAAIGWHTLLNASALVAARFTSNVFTEVVIALFAVASLALIYHWRPSGVDVLDDEKVPAPAPPAPPEVEVEDMRGKLDESRYV